MSKQEKTPEETPKKKRKTRMTGTEALKPCVDCKKTKPRLTAFKPRWAGCVDHRNEKGRRYHQPGCVACFEKVNGNIRQPRCIECDSSRPKRRGKGKTPKPTPVETEAEKQSRYEALGAQAIATVVETLAPLVEPEPVVAEPEPVVVVEAQEEPSPESEDVTPEPVPEPKAARPKIASMADLSKLFALGGEESE